MVKKIKWVDWVLIFVDYVFQNIELVSVILETSNTVINKAMQNYFTGVKNFNHDLLSGRDTA